MTWLKRRWTSRALCGPVIAACIGFLGGPVAAQRPAADAATQSTLRWQNGDELPGTLVGATRDRLTWQAPILSRPMSLDLSYLESIRTPRPAEQVAPGGPFCITLSTGELIYGELIGISEEHIRTRSPRHGELSIRRAAVSGIVRVDRADFVNLTRSGGESWQSLNRQWNAIGGKLSGWVLEPPGQLSTATAARLFRLAELPAVSEIELSLEWRGAPAFTLAYGPLSEIKQRQGTIEIDTWGDELVVQTGARPDDFEPLLTLAAERKSLRLRIIWDRTAGTVAVFGDDARLLAEIAGPQTAAAGSGLFLENKGADLIIKSLRVGAWSAGQRPQSIAGQDRIRTFSGAEHYGMISALDASGSFVVMSPDGETVRVSPAETAELAVHRGAAAIVPSGNCELTFYDGAKLRAELVSVQEGVARLKTAFSDDVVSAVLAGMQELKLPTPAGGRAARGKPDSPYVLELGDHKLRGTLTSADAALGWRPAGSDDVIPIATGGTARILRTDPVTAVPEDDGRFADVLHLQSGDRVPCTIKAIDEESVVLAASVGDATVIPRDAVRAIELSSASLAPPWGFLDRRWQIVQRQANALERTDRRLIVRGRADFNHPELLKGGGFEFDLEWKENVQASINVYLFTINNVRQANSPRLQMSLSGEQLVVHVISGNQARSHVLQLGRPAKAPKRFSFITEGDELKVLVDGALVCGVPLAGMKPAGNGVNISCTFPTSTVTRVQMVNENGQMVQRVINERRDPNADMQPDDFLLAISNLRGGRAAGVFRNLVKEDEQTRHFLVIPRSRRHNPFHHALVAQNGDLLRGELLSLGSSSVQFRSGFDDVVIPRDRLAGIVWLNTDGDERPAAERADVDAGAEPQPASGHVGLMQASFLNGSILSLVFEHVGDNEVVGRHPVLGQCRVTLDAIEELRIGKPEAGDPLLAYSGWTLISAKEPVIPGAAAPDGEFGTFSPLLGKDAEDFTLDMLDGKRFRLSEHKDQIVVLDFWATWCGPCVQAFPQLLGATAEFPPDKVLFVAVNQQENAPAIQAFMESHGWNFAVALDRDGQIGEKYQVDGIPQTVVIGRGGKIERVNLGAHPNLQTGLKSAIEELLAAEEPAGVDDE